MSEKAQQESDDFSGVVVSIGTDHYETEVRAIPTGHAFVADEPGSLGGTNKGPNPFDLLLASVGTCKVITCRMYADRKGWPVDRIVATVSLDRRLPDDAASSEAESDKRDFIDTEMQFVGDLDDDQRKRLLEISNKCPVHKMITGDLRSSSKVVTE